ncbi:MAG: hypothetical protein E7329_11960 [Clostridiales bacterium]|nr:hypothetical protein [Clostridiales bacterium]
MITVFFTVLEQMIRILLFLVLGYALNRLRILPKGAGSGISRMVTMVFLPCLLIYNNTTEFNLANIGEYGQLVLVGGLFWAAITLLSVPVARKLSGGNALENGIYLYGLSFANTGAVGTPLVLALMGTAGLFQFNLYLFVTSVMTYLWGIGLFDGEKKKRTLSQFLLNLKNPITISMLLGLLLGALNGKAWMPTVAVSMAKDLGACYVPVSLVMVGYSIADYPLNEVFNRKKSYWFTLLRLVIIPLAVVLASKILGLSPFMATLAVLAAASPCGMNTVVFPASYGQDCRTGASIVLLSSVSAVITVPLLYTLVQFLYQ